MKLTPEDVEKLQTKQLANIIRKLNDGKTLTGREQTLLAQARAGGAAESPSAFASTWHDLADRLGVSRRAVQEWRKDPRYAHDCPEDRADGRHDVAAWSELMVRFGLKRADETVEQDEVPQERRTIRAWKEHREKLECTRLERKIAKEDGQLLEAAELEVAIGQLLAGVQTALCMIPATAARFLVGLRDVHEVQSRLQGEIDIVLTQLNLALFLEDTLSSVVADLPADPESSALCEKLLFGGADRAALLDLAKRFAREAFTRIGRRALSRLTDTANATDELLRDPQTGQVSDEAAAALAPAQKMETPAVPVTAAPRRRKAKRKAPAAGARRAKATRRRKA